MASQVRILTLEDGEEYQHVLYRLNKGWTIRFSLGPSLWYRNVEFFCNYPYSEDDHFVRNKYHCYEWVKDDNSSSAFEDCYAEVNIKRAGVYQFYIVTNDGVRKTCCNGSFVVDPTLRKHKGGELPMDNIIIHTVLSKLLGTFPDWKKQLLLSYESGYNMLHFSPIQELGESKSCYSIKDHQKLDPKYSHGEDIFDIEIMQHFVQKVHKSWGMFSIVDVVWNHASNDSLWLQNHHDAGYNLKNSPHMRPAFLVDRALWYLNAEIMDGKHVERGVGQVISKESELHPLTQLIREAIAKVNLSEFFIVDVHQMVEQFRNMLVASGFPETKTSCDGETLSGLQIDQDKGYRRYGCTIDMKYAVKACFKFWDSNLSHQDNIDQCCAHFKARVHELNDAKERFVLEIGNKIIHNTIGHVKYHFLDPSGPKFSEVTKLHSISVRYFSYPFDDTSYREDCEMLETDKCSAVMAHNGWVMGYDATKNFAKSDSFVYLNRELIAWGDSIKLNYGDCPEDSPFLWDYMKKYTEDMARAFHGFRIDNCHSTPIHVAEYLLDCAREIRPDLYVVAELFTNSEATDNTFINRLGINSLIRENMGAHSPRDLGRHVHRYGGEPVGSFMHPPVRPLRPSMAHAIFMDLTHDNRSLFEARSVFDMIPSAALVSATACAIGSTRGYDELVPHHIHVVNEDRMFQHFSANGNASRGITTKDTGIVCAKDALNELHTNMCNGGFNQIYVDQMTEEVCAVTRHNPLTHQSIILVAHNAFSKPDASCYPSMENKKRTQVYIPHLKIPGVLEEVLLEARLMERKSSYVFKEDKDWINGNENYLLQMHEHFPADKSKFCKLNCETNEIEFTDFIPGSIVAFKVSLKPEMSKAVEMLRHVISMFPSLGRKYDAGPDVAHIGPFSEIVKNLSLVDLNRVLYRCGEEEKSEGWGGGIYSIPGCGDMVYCGLQGLMSYLSSIRLNNDLGHPFCDNLRNGNWLMDYTANRLKHYQGTFALGVWFEAVFRYVAELPRYLIPSYFDAIVTGVYTECLDRAFSLMPSTVRDGSTFHKHLALGSLQMVGKTMDAMPPVVAEDNSHIQYNSSLAAGLPHFSVGFMRCWGRDTFISLRGLLLLTGRFDLARNIILSFAGCVRHGLIPNLLASGVGARYNSRDATWFWLKAIQDYCNIAPEGNEFLKAPVVRMYPSDTSEAVTKNQTRSELQDVIHEVLARHFAGVSFRERNAGPDLDRDMSSEGFNQSIGVCKETGFVYGGSEENCGTWMDKMGSSTLSGNAGHPATPRDGSAVEIVGLCKSALKWLIESYGKGDYRHSAVSRTNENGESELWLYEQWNDTIQRNFEEKFYVSKNSTEQMVHKREIYKDTYGAKAGFKDYQLRPNFPIAMCEAPELFVPEHAMAALSTIERHLLGPIGLKTLDPDDWKYDGFYENSLDCVDFDKARGFNYHQGPEWTWILGPFLRAKIYFSQLTQSSVEFKKTLIHIRKLLVPHYRILMSSPWKGLPELTNKDGAYCHDSCPTQAWSMACLLEVLQYIEECEKAS